MNFDRLLRGSEITGDLFVKRAGNNVLHHLEFPWGQRLEPFAGRGALFDVFASLHRAAQRDKDSFKQIFIIHRLGEKIDGAGLHGFHASRHITMPGQENDLRIPMHERLLKFQSIKTRHL